MILYISPIREGEHTVSGGARKLADQVAILNAHGHPARLLHHSALTTYGYQSGDLVVVPEMYGDIMTEEIPRGIARVSLVQNGHMIDWNVRDPERHPYLTTPDLKAIWITDAHSGELVLGRCPSLQVPLHHLHLSIGPPFSWGHWPRRKRVVYFDYKYEAVNRRLLEGLQLPAGWSVEAINGSDAQVAEMLQTSAVFFAAISGEGWCGTTAEAMTCGALIACWDDAGPWEYLERWVNPVAGGDLEALRFEIQALALGIDSFEPRYSLRSEEAAEWFAATYSREREVSDLLQAVGELTRQTAQSE